MYESRFDPLISRWAFAWRIVMHLLLVLLLTAFSLLLGMAGYWHFEGHSWSAAFMHTSFLLFGFGHLTQPQSVSGQVFLGFYGFYASLFFIVITAILLTPIAHRLLHAFHIEGAPSEQNDTKNQTDHS